MWKKQMLSYMWSWRHMETWHFTGVQFRSKQWPSWKMGVVRPMSTKYWCNNLVMTTERSRVRGAPCWWPLRLVWSHHKMVSNFFMLTFSCTCQNSQLPMKYVKLNLHAEKQISCDFMSHECIWLLKKNTFDLRLFSHLDLVISQMFPSCVCPLWIPIKTNL